MGKLIILGLVVAFLLFYIVTQPDQAADIAGAGWDALVDIAHGIGRFISNLSK